MFGLQHINGRSTMAQACKEVHGDEGLSEDNLADGSLITLPKHSHLAIIPLLGMCAVSPAV